MGLPFHFGLYNSNSKRNIFSIAVVNFVVFLRFLQFLFSRVASLLRVANRLLVHHYLSFDSF